MRVNINAEFAKVFLQMLLVSNESWEGGVCGGMGTGRLKSFAE